MIPSLFYAPLRIFQAYFSHRTRYLCKDEYFLYIMVGYLDVEALGIVARRDE